MWNVFHKNGASQVLNRNKRRRQGSVQTTTINHNILPLRLKRRSIYANSQELGGSVFIISGRSRSTGTCTIFRSKIGVVNNYSSAKPGRNPRRWASLMYWTPKKESGQLHLLMNRQEEECRASPTRRVDHPPPHTISGSGSGSIQQSYTENGEQFHLPRVIIVSSKV